MTINTINGKYVAKKMKISQFTIVLLLCLSFSFHAYSQEVCKYATGGLRIDTSAPKPALLKGIKSIYVDVRTATNLGNSQTLQKENISSLAICILENRLTNPKTKEVGPIKVIALKDGDISSKKEEIFKDGNLIVRITLEKENVVGSANEDFLAAKTLFFRSDVNDLANLDQQCFSIFENEKDYDAGLKILTKSLAKCLNKSYAN